MSFDDMFATNGAFAAFNKLVNSGSGFEWRDRGLKALIAKIEGAGRSQVEVGLVGPESERNYPGRSDITVREVGLINEFGTKDGHVPRRSFLRATLVEKGDMIRQWLVEAAEANIKRGDHDTFDDVLHYVGERTVKLVQDKIMSHPAPSNAARTIKKKGFDGSLEHFLFLVRAISHRVVRKINVEGASSAQVIQGPGSRGPVNRQRGQFSVRAIRSFVGEAAIKATGLK